MAEKIVSYEPDNCLKQGYIGLARGIVRDLSENRWLTFQVFKRDLFAMYKQSVVGLLWLIINPVVSVGTFVLLNRSGVFDIGQIDAPYPIYAVLGMAFWQLFAVGLTASANSMVNAGAMISKINFSKKSLVIASVGNSILSFLIQFVLVLLLFALYGKTPSLAILAVPLLAIPMMMFSLGIGFIVALLNSFLRDVGTAIPVLVNFLLLLTPVLYAKPKAGVIGTLTKYNPAHYLVSVPRDIILTGHSDHLAGFFVAIGLSVAVFVVCLTIFHLTESRVAERV